MDTVDIERVVRMQFTVIARNKISDVRDERVHAIMSFLYSELHDYISLGDIEYQNPNYIIHVKHPTVQHMILATPVKQDPQNSHITMTFVPWSREHELCLIPWIPGSEVEHADIKIDPYKLLANPEHPGTSSVGHFYKNIARVQHDFRSPDFSYIICSELKPFYELKRTQLDECMDVVDNMIPIMNTFKPNINRLTDALTHKAQMFYEEHEHYEDLSAQLNKAMWTYVFDLESNMDLILGASDLADTDVDLHRFKEINNIVKNGAPPAYVARLKIIHSLATEVTVGSESQVIAEETQPGGYEASMFLQEFNLKGSYNSIPHISKASAEFLAIRQSLRFIANVLSHKIMDINFDALEELMAAINKQNEDMSYLTLCATSAKNTASHMETSYLDIIEKMMWKAPDELVEPIKQLVTAVKFHTRTIQHMYNRFEDHKIQYMLTVVLDETPNLWGDRWIWDYDHEP